GIVVAPPVLTAGRALGWGVADAKTRGLLAPRDGRDSRRLEIIVSAARRIGIPGARQVEADMLGELRRVTGGEVDLELRSVAERRPPDVRVEARAVLERQRCLRRRMFARQ